MRYRQIFKLGILIAVGLFWADVPGLGQTMLVPWNPASGSDAPAPRLPTAPDGAKAARDLAGQAQVQDAQGAYAEALANYSRAIALHALPASEQSLLLFDRGLILDTLGRPDEAVADYSAALRMTPAFGPALNNRANVFRRQNRFADARRDYQASLAAGNPQPEYSWFGLGQMDEAENDNRAARDDYAHAVAANPGFALAADRLVALGGDPGAVLGAAKIHLHPPGETATPDPERLVLKPPHGVRAAAADPPPPISDSLAPNITPAHYTPDPGPDLRPALYDSASPGPQIQLGAWRSEEDAGAGWNQAKALAGDLLGGLSPHIVAAELPGKGRYYRLRAGPVQGTASGLCQALVARGLGCIPVRD